MTGLIASHCTCVDVGHSTVVLKIIIFLELLFSYSFLDPLAPASKISTVEADGAVQLRSSSRDDCEYQPQTVHTFLKKVVDKFPDKAALSIKRNGVWTEWSYTQYYQECRIVAKAFLKVVASLTLV